MRQLQAGAVLFAGLVLLGWCVAPAWGVGIEKIYNCSLRDCSNLVMQPGDSLDTTSGTTVNLPQYLLLAGRTSTTNDPVISTGSTGTIYGSNAADGDLVLQGSSASASDSDSTVTIEGQLVLWPSMQDLGSGQQVGALTTASDINLSGGTPPVYKGLDISPTVHLGASAATFPTFSAVTSSANFVIDSATSCPSNPVTFFFNATYTHESSVNCNLGNIASFYDGSIMLNSSTSNLSQTNVIGFKDNKTVKTTSSGNLTVTNLTSFQSAPTVNAASGTTTTATARKAFEVVDVSKTGSGTKTITTNIGFEVPKMTGGSTNIGVRNGSRTVYPPTTDAVSSDTDTIQPVATVINLTATAARNFTGGTDQVADGQDGQWLILFFTGSNSVTFDDGDNLQLAGGTSITLSANDNLVLLYSTTIGDWIEISTSDN